MLLKSRFWLASNSILKTEAPFPRDSRNEHFSKRYFGTLLKVIVATNVSALLLYIREYSLFKEWAKLFPEGPNRDNVDEHMFFTHVELLASYISKGNETSAVCNYFAKLI